MNGTTKLDDSVSIGFDSVSRALKKCLCTDVAVLKSFKCSPASNELLGFQGEHIKLTAKYEIDGISSEIVFFVKSLPSNNKTSQDFNNDYRLFEREASMYNNIFSQFKEENDGSAWHPRCFLAEGNDLVFEDLNGKGYKMLEMRNTLDREHCLVVLTSLARFHAASLFLEESITASNKKTYRLSDDFMKDLQGSFFNYNKWFKVGRQTALSIAGKSKIYGKETPHFPKVQAKWKETMNHGIKLSTPSHKIRNVVCHSDLWNNNLMFRYDSENKPLQCVFVDYQVCSYSPPTLDIMSFLCLTTSKSIRDNHFEEFIKHYYCEMTRVLYEGGFDIQEILPWAVFRQSCDDYLKWGLMQSLISFQFLFLDKKLALQTVNNSEKLLKLHYEARDHLMFEMLQNDQVFSERVMANINDFIFLYIMNE